MNLEFITGLLLVLTLLGVLVYLFKELVSTTRLDFSKLSLSDALARQRSTDPKPINAHLVGMAGEVIRLSDDSDRPMMVRLGSELWPARLDPAESKAVDADNPSVGAQVVVTVVDGPVVLVMPAGS